MLDNIALGLVKENETKTIKKKQMNVLHAKPIFSRVLRDSKTRYVGPSVGWSVGWLVGWSVGWYFFRDFISVTSLLLPKWSSAHPRLVT